MQPTLHNMAGLYVHIPFCAQACTYCDFHFTTKLADRDRMVQAILIELKSALSHWKEETFTTLYFGGGTPSLLSTEALNEIASVAFSEANWALEEWTLEANPEDLNDQVLDKLKEAGVDRLSIGVQSFEPDVLQWMRRIHGADKAEEVVLNAAKAGFDHLSLDLIYGVPVGQKDRWEKDLQRALDLPVDHLSSYILTAEPKTLYGSQLSKGQLVPPPDSQVIQEYHQLCAATKAGGFEHYEVSNFARPGGHSQHNSAYWDGTPYLGIGPGAHSFKRPERWWNGRSNAAYMKAAEESVFSNQSQAETLSTEDQFNEALITGLRRAQGIDPDLLKTTTGLDVRRQEALTGLLGSGKCEWHRERLRIPEDQWPMGDAITLDLMV
jgi:oxygen-independent coproporphyrinogen-3 oxidase